jgi:hypothetical protein
MVSLSSATPQRKSPNRTERSPRVANAQIINGQQTTRTLACDTDSSATILVKAIVVPCLIGEIVSATNWQNAISQSDLKSNDPEQVRLERDFHKLGYPYMRKRMTKSEARRLSRSRWLNACLRACLIGMRSGLARATL